jgi:LPS-assembly protein
MRFRFLPLYFSVVSLFSPMAQSAGAPAPLQVGGVSASATVSDDAVPTVIKARTVEAKDGQVLEATGEVELRKNDELIQADHLLFLQESKELFADGDVRVEKTGTVLTGPSLNMNMDDNTGEMQQPSFTFTDAKVRGDAKVMHILGKQEFSFESASYTSCPVGNDDWLLKMSTLELDRNTQIGTAYNARIEFMGVPFLYTPWMTFPLDNQRKSGLLAPTYGSTKKGGHELMIPIYWNIAPNYDATFSPRMIRKRGTLYENNFRYLGNSYTGTYNYNGISNDKLTLQDRTFSSLLHVQNFGRGLNGSLNLNQASDDAYLRDLSLTPALAIQKNLLNEAALAYTAGGWWSASARAQTYQTLQDPLALVVEPYRRLPQLNLDAQRVIGDGLNASLSAELVEFNHPTLVNARRTVFYPSISYALVRDPSYYVTPKLGVHSTQYSLEGNNNGAYETNYERNVPIFSTDTGMTLEREFNVYEQDYVQTLEPRIFYVNIPYREQTMPKFDSAPAPFSFVQMFTENRFLGSDRIGDADQLTAAITTRLLDGDTGNERLRVAIGERFSRQTPRVFLDAPTATTNQSDVLISVGGRMTRSLSLDSLAQYNPNDSRTEMFVATARYLPEAGKVINLGYRYTFNPDPALILKQVDFSAQWPFFGRWHMVAQSQYSLQEYRTVQALFGLEYYQDCWALRMGVRQFVTATRESSDSIFIQLELNELIRVGDDTSSTLRTSVPGYTPLNPSKYKTPAPSRP